MFDKKKIFAMVMESQAGGELFDKYMKEYKQETFKQIYLWKLVSQDRMLN